MNMKATADKITLAYSILASTKFDKLERSDKINLIKILHKLKQVAKGLEDLRDESYKKLTPEGFEEIAMKVQSKVALTPAEMLTYRKVDKELADTLKEEQQKEHEIEFEPLKDSVLEKLIDSNPDLTVGQAEIIYDFLT